MSPKEYIMRLIQKKHNNSRRINNDPFIHLVYKAQLYSHIAILLLGASTVFASAINPRKPIECPEVSAVKAEKIDEVDRYGNPNDGLFITSHHSTYKTRHNWSFQLGNIKANSKQQALELSNRILSTLYGPPIPGSISNAFACYYHTGTEHYAYTLLTH